MATSKSTTKRPAKKTSSASAGSAKSRATGSVSRSSNSDEESGRSNRGGSMSGTGSRSKSTETSSSRNTSGKSTSGTTSGRNTTSRAGSGTTTRSSSSRSEGRGNTGANMNSRGSTSDSSRSGGNSRSGSRGNGGSNERSNQDNNGRGESNQGRTRGNNRGNGGNYEDMKYSERGPSGYGNEYAGNRRGSMEFNDQRGNERRSPGGQEYGSRRGSVYGSDRNTDRYQERNESRGHGQEIQHDRNRSNNRGDRDTGWSRSEQGNMRSRSNFGDQDYYTESDWNRQRAQSWNRHDDNRGRNDDYRQSGYVSAISRPTGKNDEGLRKLFTDQLKDIYWAEKALTKALPKMIKQACSRELKDALSEHLDVTEDQIKKVEEVFQLLGMKASGKKCEAMEGLIKEANEITGELEEGSVRDAGIICAAQKVEHYEIATYGCLSTYAEILDEMEVVDLLEQILSEEKEADVTLTQIARDINWEAAEEEDYEEEEEEEDEDEDDDDDEDTRDKPSEIDAIEA